MVLVGAGVGIRAEASPRGGRAGLSVLHVVAASAAPRPPRGSWRGGVGRAGHRGRNIGSPEQAGLANTNFPPRRECGGGGFTEAPPPALAIGRIMQPPPSPPQLALKPMASVPPAPGGAQPRSV